MSVFVLTSSEYFQTLHIPLFAGRDFSEEDSSVSAPMAILSETAAQRFFPGINPLGLTFQQVDDAGRQSTVKVVGIVKDVKELVRSSGQPYPIVYRPIAQCSSPCPTFGTYQLRFTGPLPDIEARREKRGDECRSASRTRIQRGDGHRNVRSRNDQRAARDFVRPAGSGARRDWRVRRHVVRHSTAHQRDRPAQWHWARSRATVLRLIVGASLRLMLAGIAVGALGGFAASRLIQELLFGVSPADPLTFTLGRIH